MSVRLRHLVDLAPRPHRRLPEDLPVSFAPMDALKNGLGGLGEMDVRPCGDLAKGSYNFFANGDILLAKVTPCFENGKKALTADLENGMGFATSEVHVVRPRRGKIDSRFLLYLFSSEEFRAECMATMTGSGGLRRVSESAILNHRPTVTDPKAQKAIANFLDRETARIHQLIEKKERLSVIIDLRRIAVITAAVGGDIGPAAKAIDHSTSDHQARLRFMLEVAPSAQEIENLTAEDDVTFAPMDSLFDGLGGLDATRSRPLGEVSSGSYNYFRNGDILLAKVTPCFENGKKALAGNLINGVGYATSEVHVFRASPNKLDARFLIYLLSSEDFRAEGMKSMTGSGGLKRVGDAAVLNYRPKIGNVDLQRKVADFLDGEMSAFEAIKGRTKVSIDKLQEYRAALITAAVTGQINIATYGRRGTTDRALDRIEAEMDA
ncbi:hypothetical protein [Jannaschia rubra]|uniref:EcoKI restriction-modification system protein HsdS n=1 Tax=Jannaschia rubra TaxID=282197 RepID=A0A0M6XTA2_9RHOB|nr:hypothetical protein [Jannaschia rubra]CTQ33932.1 hypothetical protein JAN5088_02721 [Jannaschia rubra]SFG76450.1 type I restriction enzyme, S subunit [Jannaschia rubra]